jgi:capsule polysaccharide modification protein KpsS
VTATIDAFTLGIPAIIAMAGIFFSLVLERLVRPHCPGFWRQPQRPDHQLARAFREVVLATTQVNGNFFTREGIALAVQGCDRMLTEESPLKTLKRRVGGY